MSHWCQSVIEQVLPSSSLSSLATVSSSSLPPPPSPPKFKTSSNSLIPNDALFSAPKTKLSHTHSYASIVQYGAIVHQPPLVSIPRAPAISTPQFAVKKPNPSRFQSSTEQPPASNSWPPSLNKYVMRAFSTCNSDADRAAMTSSLEKIISMASANGILQTTVWDLEPIPVTQVMVTTGVLNASTVPSKKQKVSSSEAQDAILLQHRSERFKPKLSVSNISGEMKLPGRKRHLDGSNEFNIESLKVVGTSSCLEKDYFRLTSAPDPSTVRPEVVLKKSIKFLEKKWSSKLVDYVYMCSQLKSIRQDLTVQHIVNDFTVEVYEIHARIALESDDLNEYNQCQTQLMHLYARRLVGCEAEFVAYRILYYVYLLGNKKYEKGGSDILFVMSSYCKRVDIMSDKAVRHALQVRSAVQHDNYRQFFKLFGKVPNLGSYILRPMLDTARLQALQKICRSYRPSVAAEFISEELGFDSIHTAHSFLIKAGCVLIKDKESGELLVSTGDSVINSAEIYTQDKLLL